MEKQDLKNLLENIYHLLAEEDERGERTVPTNPSLSAKPETPLLPKSPYTPTSPMPTLPNNWTKRPPMPPCEGVADCYYRWVWTWRWVWDYRKQTWVLQGQGADGSGGYWKQVSKPKGHPGGFTPTDSYGIPTNWYWQFLRGLGVTNPNGFEVEPEILGPGQ